MIVPQLPVPAKEPVKFVADRIESFVTDIHARDHRVKGKIGVKKDGTITAFEIDDLVGRAGTITVGRAALGSPARTRVLDPHGQAHHVLVEPNDPSQTFAEGDTVLLVRREGAGFRAILHDTPRFSDWIDP